MSGKYPDDYDRRGSYSSSKRHSRSRSRSRSISYSPPVTTKNRDRSCSREIDEYSPPPSKSDRGYSSKEKDRYEKRERRRSNDSKSAEDPIISSLVPPPPPMITKVSFGMKKPSEPAKQLGIQMKLAAPTKVEPPKKIKVASAFANESDDDEVEEMPAECRMRMRNIGRDTPTSSGPNSFGKTKQGFCDSKKMFERSLKNHYEKDNS